MFYVNNGCQRLKVTTTYQQKINNMHEMDRKNWEIVMHELPRTNVTSFLQETQKHKNT